MGHSNRWKCLVGPNRGVVVGLAVVVSLTVCTRPVRAAAPDESVLDAQALAQMEERAAAAQPREQCFLYTQVVHSLTEAAGKQLADGQEATAAATIAHIEAVTVKMQNVLLKNAKRIKVAEELMEHTTRRLSDMLHLTSGQTRPALEATLVQLNAEQTRMLNEVFSE
jgi:hypothetical protein